MKISAYLNTSSFYSTFIYLPLSGLKKMGKSASPFIKEKIIALANEGQSVRAIEAVTGVAKSTVSDCIRTFKSRKTFVHKSRSGRPRKTTAREDQEIILAVKRNRFVTSKAIKEEIPTLKVSIRTIRKRIREDAMLLSKTKAT